MKYIVWIGIIAAAYFAYQHYNYQTGVQSADEAIASYRTMMQKIQKGHATLDEVKAGANGFAQFWCLDPIARKDGSFDTKTCLDIYQANKPHCETEVFSSAPHTFKSTDSAKMISRRFMKCIGLDVPY